MFNRRKQHAHEQTIAAIAALGAIGSSVANSKGRGAERMEAMAHVVAALGFDPQSIDTIEIDWKSVYVGGTCELVPVMRMKAKEEVVHTIEQHER